MTSDLILKIAVLPIGLINFAIGFFVLWKNPRSLVNRAFFILALGATVWAISVALIFLTKNFFFNQFIFYGGTLMFAGFFLFARFFPKDDRPNPVFWWSLAPFVIMLLLVPFDVFVSGIQETSGVIEPVNGPLMPVYSLIIGSYVFYAIYLTIKHFFRSIGTAKAKLQYLLFGVAIFIGSVIIFDAILPAFGVFQFNFLGLAGSVVFFGMTAEAIVYRGLLDIRVVIRKSLVYAALLALTAFVYFLSAFIFGSTYKLNQAWVSLASLGIAVAAGIFSVPLISRFFRHQIEEKTAHLQKIHDEQKQMIGEIAHGLQTPLTILKCEVDILKKDFQNPERFSSLEKSIDGVSRFIYDLLKLARLEASAEDFRKEPVNLSDLLSELIEYFSVLSQEQGVTVFSDIQPEIMIIGKKDQLAELLNNLISNAFKYTAISPEKKISISLANRGDAVELIVKDTGPGIDPEDLPFIFNRFYRSKKEENRGVKGFGLGLAICKNIAEKHGAVITAESGLGKGASFKVLF